MRCNIQITFARPAILDKGIGNVGSAAGIKNLVPCIGPKYRVSNSYVCPVIVVNPAAANVTYSLIQDSWSGEGNLDVAPHLVPGNYRLRSGSPCIDAGSDADAPNADIDGESRWDHPDHSNILSIVDIGADEFVDTDADAMADIWELEYFGDLSRDGTADDDGDGYTDKEEYESGTDPTTIFIISIVGPTDCGADVLEEEVVTIKAVAENYSTGIASVTFYANSEILLADTSPPYEVTATIPTGIAAYEIEVVAEDLLGQSAAAICSLGVIPDPLTTVIGQVVDADGNPAVGVAVTANGDISDTTGLDGTFRIPGVPTNLGPIQVEATTMLDGLFFGVKSDAMGPVGGGVTNVGILTLLSADEYDADEDCLPLNIEETLGLDPEQADTNGDDVFDGDEDHDNDGLSNCEEVALGTNPLERDSDGDGFDDVYEDVRQSGLNDANSTPAVNLYVDPAAAAGGDGTLASPFNTIQAALDAAQENDLIQLADGIYTGNENKNLSYGGKPLMLASENGAENCIIDCEDSGRGFIFQSGEGPLSILSDVTIRNGNTDAMNNIAGGIYCILSDPTIKDCVIMNNSAVLGGGIVNDGANPSIVNCTIRGNSASYGSGIYSWFSSATIEGCSIASNTARYGGGVYNYNSNGTIKDNIITKNSTDRDGSGIYNSNSSATIEDCTITNNIAGGGGGGIYNFYADSGVWQTIRNCIITGNSANYGGGITNFWYANTTIQNCTITNNTAGYEFGVGIYNEYDTNVTVMNTILWGNIGGQIYTASSSITTVTYSLIQDSWEGEGNLDVDPLLVPETSRLLSTSPCIDAGIDESFPTTDIDGESRWDRPDSINIVSTVDIGADEFVDTDIDDMADVWEEDYFGDLGRDGSTDSDLDGYTDKEEYETGTDPTVAN